jgi:hypothetical protein
VPYFILFILIGLPKLFIGGKVRAANLAPPPTVNNFAAKESGHECAASPAGLSNLDQSKSRTVAFPDGRCILMGDCCAAPRSNEKSIDFNYIFDGLD